MKAREATNLYGLMGTLRNVPGPPDKGAKFHYALGRNMDKIRTAMREVHSKFTLDPAKETEYETKRLEMLEKYGSKDEDGKPIVINGEFQGLDENEEFKAELEKLDVEFKDFIDLKVKVYSSEVKIDFFKVKPEFLPPTFMADTIDMLNFMVREN